MSVIRRLMYLPADDNSCDLSASAFNGNIYLAIFEKSDNTENSFPASIWISDTIRYKIIKYLKKHLKEKQPNTSNSVFVKKRMDDNSYKTQYIITIGTNEDGTIYLEFNIAFSDRDKVPATLLDRNIRFTIKTPAVIEDDSIHTPAEKSYEGVYTILDIFKRKFPLAAVLSSQNQDDNSNNNEGMY